MTEIPSKVSEKAHKAGAICLDHASLLLDAADSLMKKGKLAHIAYHLATLAIEEIGRHRLLWSSVVTQSGKKTPLEKHEINHIEKIFYGLLTGLFSSADDAVKSLERIGQFAQQIHSNRLAGLYVDVNSSSAPADKISDKQTETLIELASDLLEIARIPKEWTEEKIEAISWLSRSAADEEMNRYIFSEPSIKKMKELKNELEWINWLRVEFEKADIEAKEALEKEFSRKRPDGEDAHSPKWKLRFRLFSSTHKMKQKVFTKFNSEVSWINFTAGTNKKSANELIIDITFHKAVPVAGLGPIGWGYAKNIATALSIATFGVF